MLHINLDLHASLFYSFGETAGISRKSEWARDRVISARGEMRHACVAKYLSPELEMYTRSYVAEACHHSYVVSLVN